MSTVTLNDLTADKWTVVARCVETPHGDLVWLWDLPSAERGVLNMAREGGSLITVQKRGEDGRFRLLAKLRRVGPARVRVVGG